MTYRHAESLERGLAQNIENVLRDANTAIPGFIESYDPETRTAEVSISFVQYNEGDDGSENEDAWPKLPDVPVLFPGGGDFHMSWPLANGDPVLIVFCQRDIIRWFATDGKEPHADMLGETMGANGAICIPRLYPARSTSKPASKDDALLEFKGAKFILKANGDVVIDGPRLRIGSESAGTALANGDVVDSHLSTIATRVDVLSGVIGLPPMALIGNRKSSKAFTND